MRFSSVSSILTTAAALFASTALATSPSSSSSTTDQRYEKYHAISPKSSIDLDSAIFNDVISAPRDYYVAALLTARDHRYGCTICRDVQPEFDLLAGSWNKGVEKHGDETPKVIWGTLDFMKGRPIFQQMMLQSAPVLLVYAPTTGPNAKPDKAPFKYDFNSQMTAEQLYNLISRLIPDGYKPPIHRPTNWARIITLTTALLGTFTLFT
ncbi:oligosaccharyl transferase subunit ost3/OST6, partial [Ascosphaera atra]